jgi:lipid A ethanolaminephosphotransferase
VQRDARLDDRKQRQPGFTRSDAAVYAVAAFFLCILNLPFLRQFCSTVDPRSAFEWCFVAVVILVAFLVLSAFFSLFIGRYLFKPAIIFFLLLTSAATYFINEYGIAFDVGMMRNITHTDTAEALDLITGKLVIYVVALGLAPAVVLWRLPITYRPFRDELWQRTKVTILLLPFTVILLLPFTGSAMSLFREHRIMLHAFVPLNYVSAAALYFGRSKPAVTTTAAAHHDDARKGAVWSGRKRKTVTVLVIGETARARNFSLLGYERETNPLLSKMPGLIVYSQVRSCGTATAQSVPCMFSGAGRAGHQGHADENGLLQVLQRAGFSILWRENQGGCVGVCKGIPTEYMPKAGNRSLFELGEAMDERLVADLDAKIDAMPGDGIIVLHMMGSHGPAYYKRYPPEFERFRPACRDAQFSRCQGAEIVNSYDNTILYTDYVLAKLIALLAARDQQGEPTAMIYVSDHGESLGEGNIYLHGLPYALAPDVQKHVPMLLWLSPKAQLDLSVDTECLQNRRHEALTHDNLFHSVLGLLNVETKPYNARLDIFAECRGGVSRARLGE